MACFRLLRQVERDMTKEDMKNARFITISDHVTCCIWVLIMLPNGLKQENEKDRKHIEVYFKEIELTIKLPPDEDCYGMGIRVLWVKFDHQSDHGASFNIPKMPETNENDLDLLEFSEKEYEKKLKIREEQLQERQLRLKEKKALLEKYENPPAATTSKSDRRNKKGGMTSGRTKKIEPEFEPEPEILPHLPTPSELILMKEDEMRREIRKHLFLKCDKSEINLRKYKILGGVYHIDLVYQPPQPNNINDTIQLTILQAPQKLEYVPFSKPYKAPPPAPDTERTPEVIEAEMKALEAAMEALALVTVKLPDSVLWFEPPLVAHWIPNRKIWSTKDIHDIKYNEEKQTITFRTGRLGIHGLAGLKFINLPFQSWDLKPETSKNNQGGVIMNIAAAALQAEFIIREDLVCLNSFVGGVCTSIQQIIGQYMKLHFLIERMQEAGCDIFPERDAYSYIKGLSMKHSITEKHLQKCMGLLCRAYSFSWSRWNATRISREIVLQFKELHGCVAKERSNVTLLVTPLQTLAIQCTEVSSDFCNTPIDGDLKFYADLYQLVLHNAGIKSRILIRNVSYKLASTVTKLLECTNVISMSS